MRVFEGMRVICNGHPGIVQSLTASGMCNVRLERGDVCVDPADLKPTGEKPAAVNAIKAAESLAVATGTPNQQERWCVGLLPEDELLSLARDQLFTAFAAFARWSVNRDRDRMAKVLRHATTHGADLLDFETCDVGDMTADEWAAFKRITQARQATEAHDWLAPGAVKIEPLQHWITCEACGAELARISVKVTIAWAGRDLVREYSLEPSK